MLPGALAQVALAVRRTASAARLPAAQPGSACQRPGVQRVPGLDPGGPVVGQRGARRRSSTTGGGVQAAASHAAAAEPEGIDRQQALRLALFIEGWVCSSICTSACSRRTRGAPRVAAQPGIHIAADHAVQRRTRQAGQAFVRGVPAQRRTPAQQEAVAGEQAAARRRTRPASRFVQLPAAPGRSGSPVRCPGASARGSAGPRPGRRCPRRRQRLARGPGQPAAATPAAQGTRQRTFVRWRQAPFVGLVARTRSRQRPSRACNCGRPARPRPGGRPLTRARQTGSAGACLHYPGPAGPQGARTVGARQPGSIASP
jgi:hypothetical protein